MHSIRLGSVVLTRDAANVKNAPIVQRGLSDDRDLKKPTVRSW